MAQNEKVACINKLDTGSCTAPGLGATLGMVALSSSPVVAIGGHSVLVAVPLHNKSNKEKGDKINVKYFRD